MATNHVNATAGASPAAASKKTASEGGLHGRVSTFSNITFRPVATPATLDVGRAGSAFERHSPLRSLAAAGVQRQLLQESQRSGRSVVALPTPGRPNTAAPAAVAQVRSDNGLAIPAADAEEPDASAAANTDPTRGGAGGTGPGGGSVRGLSKTASEHRQHTAQYRMVAAQHDLRDAQEQCFAQTGLPGARLFTEAADPKAVRPALRQLLAIALRASADLPAQSGELPGPQAAQMSVIQAYLQIAPGDESALNLGGIKQLLMEACAQIPPRSSEDTPQGERRSDLLLLLPLMMLNAERPRTGEQRQLAMDRLGLMRASRVLL
jgi:hypothetical protein